jgi:YVTN family beta-propeller protein
MNCLPHSFAAVILLCSCTFLYGFPYSTNIAKAQTVLTNIPVGSFPGGVAFNPVNGRVYVANTHSDSVSVIDGSTNMVIKTVIGVGSAPFGIAINSAGDIYVANIASETVAKISGKTDTISKVIPVNRDSFSASVNPSNGNLYVSNPNSESVSIIQGLADIVLTYIEGLGISPTGIAYDSTNKNLYVSDQGSNLVFVVDTSTNRVIKTIEVGMNPRHISINPTTNKIYIANPGSSTVSIIDGSTDTVVNTIPSIREPPAIAIDIAHNRIFVASFSHPSVIYMLDGFTNKVTTIAQFDGWPQGIAYDPLNGNLYVSDIITNSVHVVSTVSNSLDTIITSAIDGSNIPINSGDSTVSNKITFTFKGNGNVVGFECSIDNSAFSRCSSPISISSLNAGNHVFRVRALDSFGNRDPTPAAFTWQVLTPLQGIQKLSAIVNAMQLSSDIKSGLNSRLSAASVYLSDNNPSNDIGACSQLNAFISLVNQYSANGRISVQQASLLTQGLPYSAQEIKAVLGCR